MNPTNRLRFVERESYVKNGEAFSHPFKYRVLQQWWEEPHVSIYTEDGEYVRKGEWRDVPLEAE